MKNIFLKIKQDLYQIRFGLLFLISYCVITQLIFETVCPFLILTNIPCPACGLTRASIYLLTGNVEQAIQMNWTVFLWFVLIVGFIIDRYIKSLRFRLFPNVVIFVCVVTLARYIFLIKNIFFI